MSKLPSLVLQRPQLPKAQLPYSNHKRCTNLVVHLFHGSCVSLGHRTLMVTKDSHHAVRLVVRIQQLLLVRRIWCVVIQLVLESDRRVICTKHLSCQAFHIRRQVLVETSSLKPTLSIQRRVKMEDAL